MEFSHYSVMLKECIDALAIKPDGRYVDGTCGGAGHSSAILSHLTEGKLLSIDQDEDAINVSRERLAPFGDRSVLYRDNFSNLSGILDTVGFDRIDGILLDLGVSSYQLDSDRGFSYRTDERLDMRMSREQAFSAYDLVNTYSEAELRRVINDYGEEKFAAQIARRIVSEREKKPIVTTFELADIIRAAIPAKAAHSEAQHPAKRTFQGLRIEVNKELDVIEPTIEQAVARMNPGGRIVILTFHSLEDRIVKSTFNRLSTGCTCPPDFPVCVCGNHPKIRIINKKPLLPSETELNENPRSHSAKLRIAEKI